MLFRDVLFLSALVASVSASVASIHPLLVSRQNLGQCQNQCALLVQKQPDLQSGACDMTCICTNTFISAVTSCLNCLQASGQNLNGVPSNFASQLVSECNAAGYPVSGGSGSGSSGGSTGTLGGSGSGSTGLGGLGGTATNTAGSLSSTGSSSSGSGGGFSIGGKNGAASLSANLSGVLAVAVAVGLVVMSA